MTKDRDPLRDGGKARLVREPVQVYLAPDDSDLLSRLAADTGFSKAEILRRGLRSFASETGLRSPMLDFMAESAAGDWPADLAARHDDVLAESVRAKRKSRQ